MKWVPLTQFCAKSQFEGTIQFVPKPQKMVMIIILRRRRETWEGVPVATWCSEWICNMWGEPSPHVLIISASLFLPRMRGAAKGRAPTILQNDSFYTRISNFVQSPILSATRDIHMRTYTEEQNKIKQSKTTQDGHGHSVDLSRRSWFVRVI